MTEKNPKMDEYLKRAAKAAELRPRSVMLGNAKGIMAWKAEFEKLRKIALSFDLDEEIKWGQPCYTSSGKNIVIISGGKEFCTLAFFKGVLLKDPKKILVAQTENVQAGRYIKFKSMAEIDKLVPVIKDYIKEAIEIEKSGKKVPHKETNDYPVPEELTTAFTKNLALKDAFEKLTPGRQRGYLYYFAQAKQSKTREERIEKYTDKIMDGLGFDER